MKTLITIFLVLATGCLAQSPQQFFQAELAAIPRAAASVDYITNGLVAWWKFNDAGSGTAVDSISTNNGILESAPTATNDQKGVANQAYNFNGNQQRIKFSATALGLGNTMSISFWAKQWVLRDNMTAFARTGPTRGEGIYNWIYGSHANSTLIAAKNGGTWLNSGAAGIQVGVWYMYTYTVSSAGAINFYVNSTNKGNGASFTLGSNGDSVFAATFYSSGGNLYDWYGGLCNVRIYNKELSQSDITAIYTLEKP